MGDTIVQRLEQGMQRLEGEGPSALSDALDCVLRFGAMTLRAGCAEFYVRDWMGVLARAMRIDTLAVHVTLGSMTATARRDGAQTTVTNEIAPLGINAWRMAALEHLAQTAAPGVSTRAVTAQLDAIEAHPPAYPLALVAIAIGAASAAFSYLNRGGPLEVLASFIGGGIGQAVRSLMFRRRLNQYAVTAVCAVVASGFYCLIMMALSHAGFATPRHAAGYISSVLFLVPGFPLVAALSDLLQNQTVAGIARLASSGLVLVTAAFGLSLISIAAGLTAEAPPPFHLSLSATVLLRGVASMGGAAGFAILYNSPRRTVLMVAGLTLVGNELRLALCDSGVALAPATFVGALTVGLLASLVRLRMHETRISLTVPGIIMMVPGTLAFQTVVLIHQDNTLAAVRAGILASFVIGAMALGLATARFLTERRWLVES